MSRKDTKAPRSLVKALATVTLWEVEPAGMLETCVCMVG